MDPIEMLLAELDAARSWPIPRERGAHQRVADRRAIRKGDKRGIRRLMNWDAFPAEDGQERNLVIDPLARLIARGFADFLFGEDPSIDLPDGGDEDALAELDDVNRLGAGLHRAARLAVSEGEVWGKAHVNREIATMPMLEWHSRLSVVPLWYGHRPIAVAFVTERQRDIVPGSGDDDGPTEVVWRHVEAHAAGVVRNALYRGNNTDLGERAGLDQIPSTADLADEWRHGLPMLAWRVVNDTDDDPHLGDDDLEQVRDELFMLNEAMTIASENARLTGKDRVFATGEMLRKDGSLPTGVEVFQVVSEGGVLGEDASRPPVVAVEKSYDAGPLWLHITKLVSTVLTRVGLVPQFIGEDVDGSSDSGTAIRLRFLPTDNAARGKAREWDAALPQIIDALLRLAALPEPQGGFGRPYSPSTLPAVRRGDVLPVDEGEDIRDQATAVQAGIRSRRAAIRELHPDWSDDQVDDELAAILDEERQLVGAPPSAPPPPAPPPPAGDD